MSDHSRLISRRRFVQAAAGGSCLAIGRHRLEAAQEASGWIDAHVHVWSPDTDRYPLGDRFQKADMKPASFTAEQLFEHCRPVDVRRIVLIQMSFYQTDHSYMFKVMKDHPGVFSAVALIDYQRDDVEQRMIELKRRGVRGFRLHSHGDADRWVGSPTMATLWRTAAKEGLAVCPLINPPDLDHVETLCQRHPDTTVVIDHFARIGISGQVERERLDQLCRLARFPAVHVKTSAFYALGKQAPPYRDLVPMIRRLVDAYGPQRLMWASDCPFQVQGEHSYQASIALIRDQCQFLSDGDRQWMLRGTAEKVFFA